MQALLDGESTDVDEGEVRPEDETSLFDEALSLLESERDSSNRGE